MIETPLCLYTKSFVFQVNVLTKNEDLGVSHESTKACSGALFPC